MCLLLNSQYIILKLASIKILQKTVDYNYDQGTLASEGYVEIVLSVS
jgi:hypothetical protein